MNDKWTTAIVIYNMVVFLFGFSDLYFWLMKKVHRADDKFNIFLDNFLSKRQ